MIRCNNCGTNNIDGSAYCDECGMKLEFAAPRSRPHHDAPVYQPPSAVPSEPMESNTSEGPAIPPPSFTTSTSMPKPAMPARERREQSAEHKPSRWRNETDERSVLRRNDSAPAEPFRAERSIPPSPNQTFALSSSPHTDQLENDPAAGLLDDNPKVTAKLVIERGGRIGREFAVTGIETNIGRWDADSGIFPDVDLDEDDPEAKVSRRHARIINHNGQYFIEDLGSTNGTFVNRGRRLLPGKRQALQNGDEVIVGKTFLKFQILR